MSPKKTVSNPAGNKTKNQIQEDIETKLHKKALRILMKDGIVLSEGREERLKKVVKIIAEKVTNNSLSPEGKQGLPKLLQGFLRHRIKVYKGEVEETEPDNELLNLIDELYLELGELELIQRIGHGIADLFQKQD